MVKSAFGEVELGSQTPFRTVTRREGKIVYNLAGVNAIYDGMAEGVGELMAEIRDEASAAARVELWPAEDAALRAKRGVGLMADTAWSSVWAMGKLVAGTGEKMASQNKPKGAKTPSDQIVGFVAFSSPLSHLKELGTIREPARAFLTPAVMANVGNAGEYVKGAMSRYAASAPQRAAIKAGGG